MAKGFRDCDGTLRPSVGPTRGHGVPYPICISPTRKAHKWKVEEEYRHAINLTIAANFRKFPEIRCFDGDGKFGCSLPT